MSWPRIKAEMLWRLREQRAKEDPAGKMRVRGGFRIARGKRVIGATIQHREDTGPSHMEGTSAKGVHVLCTTRKSPHPAEVRTGRFLSGFSHV
ncbi:hypothetical protein NBRC111894_4107 [Sporolactobacillus inulinus]|uniref:Uncharacterized protein n=1 Tax=Sporolactobacillus inulinus TaxID=2078 RepID=A0A4Y1ZHV2_9BACL|nr:hypothetical protein NBRC111894_4107 [Sporolactobacillus inulinus]